MRDPMEGRPSMQVAEGYAVDKRTSSSTHDAKPRARIWSSILNETRKIGGRLCSLSKIGKTTPGLREGFTHFWTTMH